MPQFGGQELVGGEEGARELGEVGGQILVRDVPGVADEQLVLRTQVVIHAGLEEVLVDGLIEGEPQLGETSAERGSIRQRVGVEIGLHRGGHTRRCAAGRDSRGWGGGRAGRSRPEPR